MSNSNPLNTSTKTLIGKWKPLLLWHMSISVHRFSDIKRCIPNASPKMITQQLRELESDGLINRKVYPVVPPKVEYSLTDYGKTAIPLLLQFKNWGVNHLKMNSVKTTNDNRDFNCICLLGLADK